jgi:hypothetical protein
LVAVGFFYCSNEWFREMAEHAGKQVQKRKRKAAADEDEAEEQPGAVTTSSGRTEAEAAEAAAKRDSGIGLGERQRTTVEFDLDVEDVEAAEAVAAEDEDEDVDWEKELKLEGNKGYWKNWQFTAANVAEADKGILSDAMAVEILSSLYPAQLKAWVFQREVGDKTHKEHLQGFVTTVARKRLAGMKAMFSEAATAAFPDIKYDMNQIHFEGAYSTALANFEYCTKKQTRKPGHDPHSMGTFADSRSRRPGGKARLGVAADLMAATNELKEGKAVKDVALAHPLAWVKNGKGIMAWIMAARLHKVRKWQTRGVVIFGATGTGKSVFANMLRQGREACYHNVTTSEYWDAYNGEDVLILDEIPSAVASQRRGYCQRRKCGSRTSASRGTTARSPTRRC